MTSPPRRRIVIPIKAVGPMPQQPASLAPQPAVATAPAGSQAVRWRIEQMDCPTEERLIRQKLEPLSGVLRLDFNLLSRELTAHHTLDDVAPLEAALREIGMGPRRLPSGEPAQALPPAVPLRTRWLLAGAGAAAVAAVAAATPAAAVPRRSTRQHKPTQRLGQ